MAMAAAFTHQASRLAQQTLLSTTLLPQELIMDILSRVPVKSLMRFRCVSKALNSLTFDPSFIKLHLQRSTKNTHVLITYREEMNSDTDLGHESALEDGQGAAPCSIRCLLENPSSTISDCFRQFMNGQLVFGSCNGLVCFCDSLCPGNSLIDYWVRFWNPATKIMSQDSPPLSLHWSNYIGSLFALKFGFGFDDSCDTYKVVAIVFNKKSLEREVRVHCLGDTCWRKILTCPAFPILREFGGKFASGTLNWLALRGSCFEYEWDAVTIDQLVIFSYDLKNETYTNLLMPDGLSEVPCVEPDLRVLKGCLCLSHDHKKTHFVVWLMMEFGVEKSWTQLLNVSYNHLQIHGNPPRPIMPLCMSENEDVMFLADDQSMEFVVYNLIDNRVDRDHDFKDYTFRYLSYEYVQSLVLPY